MSMRQNDILPFPNYREGAPWNVPLHANHIALLYPTGLLLPNGLYRFDRQMQICSSVYL